MFKDQKFIGDLAATRMNNFDFLRFLAATSVIISHAYPLSWGNGDTNEPLFMLTGGQVTIGRLAVAIFFIISGFLITQSFDRSKSIFSFFKARFLRIFPGLIFVVLLSAFVLGPIITTKSVVEYYNDPNTYQYLKNIILHPMIYPLPGVFAQNPHRGAVNGSLWTLEYEAFCYLLVACLGFLRLLRKEFIILLFIFVLASPHLNFIVGKYYFTSLLSIELIKYFTAGMVFYALRNYIPLHKYIAWFSAVILIIGFAYPTHLKLIFAIFGSYLIMYAAFRPTNKLHAFSKYGDFSYGIYIYAFPVQQLVSYWLGKGITPAKSMLFTFPITLIFAVISWHLVEKNALKLKNLKPFSMIAAMNKKATTTP